MCRYVEAGKPPCARTLGGRPRFPVSALRELQRQLDETAGAEGYDTSAWLPGGGKPGWVEPTETEPESPMPELNRRGTDGRQAAASQKRPRLVWNEDTAGVSKASGEGWSAEIRAAGDGYVAVLELNGAQVIRRPCDGGGSKSVDHCKRWVRRTLDSRDAEMRRRRDRGRLRPRKRRPGWVMMESYEHTAESSTSSPRRGLCLARGGGGRGPGPTARPAAGGGASTTPHRCLGPGCLRSGRRTPPAVALLHRARGGRARGRPGGVARS